jgi:hypothetical protein
VDCLAVAGIARRSHSWWDTVLGVVGFDRPPPIDAAGVPVTASMTPLLGATDAHCEVWRVADGHAFAEAASPNPGCGRYRCVDAFLFGSLTLESSARVVYLLADVCRADLLMEIEATGERRRPSPAAA